MNANSDAEQLARDWWRTEIIEMSPGVIRFRGYPIEELIGRVSLAQMIWLMTRGELPTRAQGELLDAALMAGVDHGPQAPSIAIARMAATCGVGLNNAMASAVNVLGDVHGGAGEQSVELFLDIAARIDRGETLDAAVRKGLDDFTARHGKFVPGFGHRFHPIDPRAAPLLGLVDAAAKRGEVSGRFAHIARAVEAQLAQCKAGKRIPLNIDGATAVIYAELGFPAPLARGLFCLSRSVGILAHAWEQMQQGGRNKGPIPRQWTPTYDGQPQRPVPDAAR
jgi:citrate synthase